MAKEVVKEVVPAGEQAKTKVTPQEKYDKAHAKRISLKLNKGTDEEILEWLKDKPSKQGAIREALHDYVKRLNT